MLQFEWTELCRQLGVDFPMNVEFSKIDEKILQLENPIARDYFKSYFSDILARGTRRVRKIKQHNAPRGVFFTSGVGYYSHVCVFGQRVDIPPNPDPEPVSQLRQRILTKMAGLTTREEKNLFVSRVEAALKKRKNPNAYSGGIITPDMGTPMKKLRFSTPLTVPHRITAGTVNEPEILKFRDKFYCRYQVCGEFLSFPMRQTRTEAESDLRAITAELSSVAEPDLAYFRAFNQSFIAPSHLSKTPQTEAKPTIRKENDIFKIRDRFYTSMRLFDQQLSTPLRQTMNEAMRDRDKLHSEIEGIQNTKFQNDQERAKKVSEIKMRISSSYLTI